MSPDVRRDILVMTCSQNPAIDRDEVAENFRRDNFCEERVFFEPPNEITRTKWHARTKRREEVKTVTPVTLSCAVDAKMIAAKCLSGDYSALVIPKLCTIGTVLSWERPLLS